MRRIACMCLIALALGLIPKAALAHELRWSRTPVSLDLPARARLGDRPTDGVRQPTLSPSPMRNVLSEDATLVVIGAAVIGVVLLVVIVSAVAS